MAEALVIGGLGVSAVWVGLGVANADPSSAGSAGNKVVPIITGTTLTSTGTTGLISTGTAVSNGNKVVPTIAATTITSTGTAGATQAGLTSGLANGNVAVPTTAAPRFGGEQARSAGGVAGLNPHGWVARQNRLSGGFGGLLGRALGRRG